jgi:hypothetical protein
MNLGVRWLCVFCVRVLHSGCGSGLFVFLVECRLLLLTLRAGVGGLLFLLFWGVRLCLEKSDTIRRCIGWEDLG